MEYNDKVDIEYLTFLSMYILQVITHRTNFNYYLKTLLSDILLHDSHIVPFS